jgi:S-adenosyl-L-methionine hydrolase (adenosine-forming)
MAIITFTSDFGLSDHYVAAFKARVMSINPNLPIIDISHQISRCDIGQAAFVVRAVYKSFPKGTVHVVAVEEGRKPVPYIAIKSEEHFFIGANDGMFGLLLKEDNAIVVDINSLAQVKTTFAARDIMAPAAAKLASGTAIHDLGKALTGFEQKLPTQFRANKGMISGHVIRVDHYGNLITNIEKDTFDILHKGRPYSITFGRESLKRLHESPFDVEPGDCFTFFNSLGYLEIGINQGDAYGLLGLSVNSSVTISFEG